MSNGEQNESISDTAPVEKSIHGYSSEDIPTDKEPDEGVLEFEELKEDNLELEEFINEDEESLKTQYQVENKSNAVAAVGDHAQVTIYNYINIVSESRKGGLEDNARKEIEHNLKYKSDLIEALKFERQSRTFLSNTEARYEGAKAQLPLNEDDIDKWYYQFDEYEQCYIQAVAILHGAAVKDISRKADSLYLQIIEQERLHGEGILQGTSQPPPNSFSSSSLLLRHRSSRELQVKTGTILQRIENVERLFWRDSDAHGISTFEFRLLDFLAGEFMNKGLHGQHLLERVCQWSEESEKEYSWFSARALGVFLWRQDVDELRKRANEWAKTHHSMRSWRRTAMLLDGAYEIDSLKYPHAKAPFVLQLLDEWVKCEQQALRQADVYAKCAAANTYGLIGKRKLEVALEGLKQLLPLTQSESASHANKLLAAVVSAYISLSWSGHLNGVLQNLAHIAEETMLQQTSHSDRKLAERNAYRLRYQTQLNVVLEVFFLIAADSLVEAATRDSVAYSKPLPDPPSLPDPLGRDILLTGLLQNRSEWHRQIITLLCAAIVERNGKNRPAAFALIQRWAQTLSDMQERVGKDEKKQHLISFTQFIVELGETIHSWCCDLKKQKKYSPPANLLYKKQLEQWSRGKSPIASLAKDVLCQLNHLNIYQASQR